MAQTQVIGSISAEKLLGMQIDFATKLRSGAISIGEVEEFLNRRNPFRQNAEAAKPNLLQYVGKFHHGGHAGEFDVKNCFKKDNSDGIKFSGFGGNFTSNFLEKVENKVPKGELKAHKLLRGAKDPEIIAALGDGHETYLVDLYGLLTQQYHGEDGLLLTNGFANIFYIRDASGNLWAVYAFWDGGGWDVLARSIVSPIGWNADRQVFGRRF